VFHPDSERNAVYERLYSDYKFLYEKLVDYYYKE